MNSKDSSVNFMPPAGSRDMEYESTKPAFSDLTSHPNDRGVLLRCPRCGLRYTEAFDVTVQIWDLLLLLVQQVTGVGRRELLRTGGRRPSDQLHQARACLVQCMLKVADEDAARKWLALHGIETRRFKLFREVLLEGGAKTLLENLPTALPVGQDLTIPGQQTE